jgi:hypothetical protein
VYNFSDSEAIDLKTKRFHSLSISALALCVCSLPATAGVLYSDLGPAGNMYNTGGGPGVAGSGHNGQSQTVANMFTVSGSGGFSVSEIDLAVAHAGGLATFYASIWTDVTGSPGAQIGSDYWSLSTSASTGTCCSLVSITGITGVTLTGGSSYFMVLGPLSASDNSWNLWNFNNQGATGGSQYSHNGGVTWGDFGTTFGSSAFDVLGDPSVPEPGSLLLLGTGLIGILGIYRRKSKR